MEKLETAIHSMKPGDKFVFGSICRGNNYITMKAERCAVWKDNGVSFTIGDYLDHYHHEGEIIQAGPKVLTVDEIRTKVTHDDPHNQKSYRKLMYECAELGIENGRLEMYLEVKPAIEQYRQLLSRITGSPQINRAYNVGVISEVWINEQLELLENLKPLNPGDEC